VTTVTKHVAARLAKDNLCIHGADNMASSEWATRSLLQFVHWRHVMSDEYLAPSMDASGASLLSSCQISSPWMDLIVDRRPAPLIRGIIYWNERQMLADQAALAGAKNVSPGRAMPLNPSAEAHFRGEYWRSEVYRRPATKPVEERVPPDLLWLFRRIWPDGPIVSSHPDVEPPTKKGMAGYTWLVRTLIDRCFDPSAPGRVDLHYNSILDVTDPILLDLYKIDMPNRRQSEPSPGEVS
jgi:hypothetical protein